MQNNILKKGKNHYHIKEEKIYKWALHDFFNFLLFGIVWYWPYGH
jgi:hypothetical protein